MQRMSNKVKNMRSLLLILFSAISLSVSAQTITVKGNVKDTSGEPVIGASVVEKGNTTNGTITDLDGNFSTKVILYTAKDIAKLYSSVSMRSWKNIRPNWKNILKK